MNDDSDRPSDHVDEEEYPVNMNNQEIMLPTMTKLQIEGPSIPNNNETSSFDSDSEEEYDATNSSLTKFGNLRETPEMEKPSLVPNKLKFDSIDFLLSGLESAMNSLEFDKALVIQSQVAGNLNSTSSDIQKSIESLQTELQLQIERYSTLKTILLPQIDANIKKSAKRIDKITLYLKSKYPVEYSKGRSKILENLTEDEEGLFL
ncbi:hypothetical protein CANINC_001758 [Pichia inconspicua]|uniref:Biogenesis of lysosome-related organelles complex 1 subunit KXD1 n=1 Tax=Pichia inconspicua TaxID=52247 RepID=A0A4T0X2X4_9ASCO|nr:hypothetical protein CANINC_001758 [[Candida] inconspicua]